MWRLGARLEPERGAVVDKALDALSASEGITRVEALERMAEIALVVLETAGRAPHLRGDERAAVVVHLDLDTARAAVATPAGDREADGRTGLATRPKTDRPGRTDPSQTGSRLGRTRHPRPGTGPAGRRDRPGAGPAGRRAGAAAGGGRAAAVRGPLPHRTVPQRRARCSTSDGPDASCPTDCSGPCCTATVAVPIPAAGPARVSRHITCGTGSGAAGRIWRTWCCCAATTTTPTIARSSVSASPPTGPSCSAGPTAGSSSGTSIRRGSCPACGPTATAAR